jgi:predicted N-formylglutamate amidohydrolase
MDNSVGAQLLAGDDPDPVGVVRPEGGSRFLLTGDHAGRAVPRALADLGLAQGDLARHIGIDIGIEGVGSASALLLDATFIYQRYSRLVIDCNRQPAQADAFAVVSDGTRVPGNAALDEAARAARIAAIFRPYHRRIAAEIDARLARGAPPVVVALHSFTPHHGDFPAPRPWHLGVLWNRDARLARAVVEAAEAEGDLLVGQNQPYVVSDTHDYGIPVHGEARGLLHVEIEIRQDLIAHPAGQAEWAGRLQRILPRALARQGGG